MHPIQFSSLALLRRRSGRLVCITRWPVVHKSHKWNNSAGWQIEPAAGIGEHLSTMKPRIERSGEKDRGFSDAEIRGFVEETKKRQSAPGYAAAEAKRKREAEARSKGMGIKFPELAKQSGTKPALANEHPSVAVARRRINLLDRKI